MTEHGPYSLGGFKGKACRGGARWMPKGYHRPSKHARSIRRQVRFVMTVPAFLWLVLTSAVAYVFGPSF